MSTICISRICRESQSSFSTRSWGCKPASSTLRLNSLSSQLRTTDQSMERTRRLPFRMTPVTRGNGSLMTTTRSRTRPTRCCRTSTTSALMKALRKINTLAPELLEQQRGIVPAEAEGVRKRQLDVELAGALRDVIEVALGIRVLEVDGRGRAPLFDRFHRDDRLDGSGGPQQVAHHRLGRADRNPVGRLPEDVLHRQRFCDVAQLGRGAMRIDVAHVLRRNAGFDQGALHGLRRTRAHRVGGGDVAG